MPSSRTSWSSTSRWVSDAMTPSESHSEAVLLQTCSLEMDCESNSVMAATLANGGTCPITGEKLLSQEAVSNTLSLMYSCGMSIYSGQFAFQVKLIAYSSPWSWPRWSGQFCPILVLLVLWTRLIKKWPLWDLITHYNRPWKALHSEIAFDSNTTEDFNASYAVLHAEWVTSVLSTFLSVDYVMKLLTKLMPCQCGLPAMSAVSGAMMLVIPKVMGITLWSPPLDRLNNSVRGVQFCQELIRKYAFHE